ncbi:MAG: RNA pseudouridine synthase [Candidatus Cloacimonadota bacterium]|nr:MAG: RNA pseudouridine synthase [Candidatus Cloacimonadota bacterium]PIE81255.1 MAG: RNA pseudouridine synthase [Candidatus Delongbacteria bacterium]
MRKIFEDENFLFIDKDCNLNFHSTYNSKSLIDMVRERFNIDNLYTLHRLDKVSSGVIVFGKNIESVRRFNILLTNKKLSKYYIALSDRKPKKSMGKVVGDMIKSRGGSYKLLKSNKNPAITLFSSRSLVSSIRLFLIKILTGKTHQIRVAMKSLGSPIIGDERYGSKVESERVYLHSYKISFTDQGRKYSVSILPNSGKLFKENISILEKKIVEASYKIDTLS